MAIHNVVDYYKVNLDNGLQLLDQGADAYVDVWSNNSAIVRANAAASLVLLKNVKTQECLAVIKTADHGRI
jgi:beta-glucosidase